MNAIILYGSQYGSARRYAEHLAQQTGIAALRYQDAPPLADLPLIVYLGGLYAGGVLGCGKRCAAFLPAQDSGCCWPPWAWPTRRWRRTGITSAARSSGSCPPGYGRKPGCSICGGRWIMPGSRGSIGR